MSEAENRIKLYSFIAPALLVAGEKETGTFKLEVLYRGSQDGIGASIFHNKCDGKCNTLSVIRDQKQSVFGGFADMAWTSSSASLAFKKSFLLTLKSIVPFNSV